MIRKLIVTDNDRATAILRFALGVIFFAHGAQKMLGWFGGYGFIYRDNRLFHERDAYSRVIRLPGDLRRILWRPWPDFWVP